MKKYAIINYKDDITLVSDVGHDGTNPFGNIVLNKGGNIIKLFCIGIGSKLYFNKWDILKESDSLKELTEEFLLEIL